MPVVSSQKLLFAKPLLYTISGMVSAFPADLLQQSEAARQAHFERCLIEHPRLQEACDAVIRAICMPGEDSIYRRLVLQL